MSEFDERAKNWDSDPTRIELATAVAEEIRKSVPLDREMTILDYGCGTGLLGAALLPYVGEVTFADNSKGMLEVVEGKIAACGISNARTLFIDLATDKAPKEKYDLVCASMCLHHVMEIDKVLRAFHKMINPHGWLCLADLEKEDGSFHGPDFKGHNGFDTTEFSTKLGNFGFGAFSFRIIYERKKDIGGVIKKFPIFLMTSRTS